MHCGLKLILATYTFNKYLVFTMSLSSKASHGHDANHDGGH